MHGVLCEGAALCIVSATLQICWDLLISSGSRIRYSNRLPEKLSLSARLRCTCAARSNRRLRNSAARASTARGGDVFDPKRLIAQTDPEVWGALQQELRRQEDHIELIASENYASPAVMQAQGSRAHQQVRRGLSRQALLRRLRIRRHRRAAGDRPGQAAVRRRVRQRAAAFRLAGQPGRLHVAAQAGRHHPGHVAGAWRPPDPRRLGELQRQDVSTPWPTACMRRPSRSTTTRSSAWRRSIGRR